MILEAMDVLRVEAALLRANLPDLVLRPGMTLHGRVLERSGNLGLLLLAGTPLSAELPDELAAGARLRLRVEEVGSDRVVLRALEPDHAPSSPPPPDLSLPLGEGLTASVRVTERQHAQRGPHEPAAVGLTYESPALGALDLRLVLVPGAGMQVTVGATAGKPEERVRSGADELREALGAVTGVPVSVRVIARPPEPTIDLYA
jgi:hypothetical protein